MFDISPSDDVESSTNNNRNEARNSQQCSSCKGPVRVVLLDISGLEMKGLWWSFVTTLLCSLPSPRPKQRRWACWWTWSRCWKRWQGSWGQETRTSTWSASTSLASPLSCARYPCHYHHHQYPHGYHHISSPGKPPVTIDIHDCQELSEGNEGKSCCSKAVKESEPVFSSSSGVS